MQFFDYSLISYDMYKNFKFNDVLQFMFFFEKNLNNFFTSNKFIYLENINFDLYHYSIPNVKLYYPEPFIASPQLIHDDIWWLHIVIYQYWLWFFFISTIVFFFLVFSITVRWCNISNRPIRETRGVSRSKCGDLITATVPISWATSIIIHESTDAIELADGFGTTELAIGIRAYQWGWEYYYPKDMDLYFFNKNSNFLIGKTLKYTNSSLKNYETKKFYLNQITNDFNDFSKNPFFFITKSCKSINLSFLSTLSFGINKLLNRKASNLITTNKLLTLKNFNFNWSINNSIFYSSSINFYKKYYFDSSFLTRPTVISSYYNYLNKFSSFSYSMNFSNLNNLYQFFSKNITNNYKKHFIISNNITIQLNKFVNFFLISSNNQKFHTMLIKDISNKSSNQNYVIYKMFLFLSSFINLNTKIMSPFAFVADQDFKKWALLELFDDLYWDININDEIFNYYFQLNKFTKSYNYQTTNLKTNINNYIYYMNSTNFFDLTIMNKNIYNSFKQTTFNSLLMISTFDLSKYSLFVWHSDYLLNSFFNFFHLNIFSKIFNYNVLFMNFNFFKSISIYELLKNYTLKFDYIINIFNNWNINYKTSTNSNFLTWEKNLLNYNQAFTKIFKSILEEERTLSLYSNFSKFFNAQIFISEKPSILTNLFAKNTNSFINLLTYKSNYHYYYNSNLNQLWNYFNLNFPYSISFESDIIRYSWFDWYSTRNMIITKSIDTSVFGLHGSKYYSFNFTNNRLLHYFNQVENFYNKFFFARKLVIPSFTYMPYFYTKYFFSFNYLIPIQFINIFKTLNGLILLNDLSIYFSSSFLYFNNINLLSFFSAFSFYSSPMHTFTLTFNNTLNNINVTTKLIDILTKREFLYRKLTVFTNSIIPLDYITSNINPILNEFKNLSQYSLTSSKSLTNLSIKQSQYQAMRKGITNMLRIQADKAIAMPIETRIQILAVSKDIIHSWAIPSAGVKIDCIPGYSSHKVIIFLISGIYWGQCMEICGRFHHWMPIVVYFMKRDLFCLWCIHFIFKNKSINNINQGYLFQSINYNYIINYSWNNWIYEF